MVIGSIWGDEKLDLCVNKELTETLLDYLEIITEKINAAMAPNDWKNRRLRKFSLPEHSKGVVICETPEQLMENL